MKKITLFSFLALFLMSSVAFGKVTATVRGRHEDRCHEDREKNECCKLLKEFKCILDGLDSTGDKTLCRLEDLQCMVTRLLELLDYDLGCKVTTIEKEVHHVKETTNEILYCALAHIKEQLCHILREENCLAEKLNCQDAKLRHILCVLEDTIVVAIGALETALVTVTQSAVSVLESKIDALGTSLSTQLTAISTTLTTILGRLPIIP